MLSAEMHGIFQHIISRDCSRVLGLDAHFSRSTLTERNLGYSTCQWIKGKHSSFGRSERFVLKVSIVLMLSPDLNCFSGRAVSYTHLTLPTRSTV